MPSVRGTSGRSRRLKNDINVVPYIDVMLVLLVIFMVTAPMITPGLIELPTVGQASEVQSKPVEVQLDKDGITSIRVRDAGADFQQINSENLVAEVQSLITADTPVVISADGRVPYETVMKVMDELRSAGVSRLGLLVDQKSAPNAQQ
ncbi:ExbD/TolR family protein [Allopusillimonas ginsengisoli]|uniref:ExbD/TolR family protein n=1 Tax=Allopusillimonas ginsengisoli TaxID=453575 RepID=UPI0010203E68|nr:ExbD/TolR family protein [Allopusillimonas ginsengisoli]TEA78179.1 ExbD/TolR family protein [Allopusillimonas ginsengisoli]